MEPPKAAGVGDASQSNLRWTDLEERTLLAEVEAARIAREEGVEVPGYLSFIPFAKTTFMPLAATVLNLTGRRSLMGVASKVPSLLPKSDRVANRVFGDTALSMLELETSELRRGDLKDRRGVKWTEVEERTLLAAMAAAGIAREEGAEVSGYLSFIPFAKTVNHLFLEHRNEMGIAQKARILLLKGPVANKGNENSAGAGVSGLIGVSQDRRKSMDKNRSLPRCLSLNLKENGL